MTTPTIPELRYHDRVMSPEPQNLSLAEVVARLREGRVVEVQLEPGDWTRYDLVLIPDSAIPQGVGIMPGDPMCGVLAIRMIGGRPDRARMLLPWEEWEFSQMSSGNEWTAQLFAWWFGCLFHAIEEATP